MDDPDEIGAVFRGTALDGRPIEEGLGDTWVVSGIRNSELLPAWRAARAATAKTGRWPVLTAVDESLLDADSAQIEALEHGARTVHPWTVYRWWGTESVIAPGDLHRRLPDLLGPAAAEQARRDLSSPMTLADVGRWTWERLLADPAALERARLRAARHAGTGSWFTPPDGAQVVLLPTSTRWLAPAWLNYFGAIQKAARVELGDDPGRTGLAAAIRQWERQWGAELVASWGRCCSLSPAGGPPSASRRGSWLCSTWQSAAASRHHPGSWLLP